MSSSSTQAPIVKSSYRIRECTEDSDAEHLHVFVRELADCAGKLDMVRQTPHDMARDGFHKANPLFYAALAEHEDNGSWEPVGFVVWYFSYSTWKGKSLSIEDLYVRENHRRNGLGTKLFGLCVKNAQELNCGHVEWVVLKWNERARTMYESLGAEYPDDGVWDLMRLDEEGIANFLKNHYEP